MPELPEVETVALGLRETVLGRRVVKVVVREPRLRWPVAPELPGALCGRLIRDVLRLGKFLIVGFADRGTRLVTHLGMSGTLRVDGDPPAIRRHDHVIIVLDGGRCLVYNDPRRFGWLALREADTAGQACLGIDPMTPKFNGAVLHALSRRRRRPIKNLMMDQSLVAGIGNIYANEILFRAGIRPGRAAGRLSRRECDAIARATGRVLREAIAHRGSSISDFSDTAGNRGGYQKHFRVYDRSGRPCRRCGANIRRRILAGRAAFYCSSCQR